MSKFARLKALPKNAINGGNAGAEPPEESTLSAMDRRVETSFWSVRLILTIVGVVALITLTAAGYWRYGLNRTLTVGAERITVSTVEYGTFQEYIPVTGNVVPRQTVYLDAVEGGQVTEILVEEGAMVEAGQPLLTLKNTKLQLDVISTEARLAEQINNLNTTKLSFEQNRLLHRRERIEIAQRIDDLNRRLTRSRRLVASGAVPAAQIEDMEAELGFVKQIEDAIAEAQQVDEQMQTRQMVQLDEAVQRISSNLGLARENLDNLVMKAPIAGQLTVFDANLGESKAPGFRIGQIDDINAFKVSAYVDEFYLTRIVIGQLASVEVGGDDYALEVAKIYPNVRDRQFQVDLDFVGDPPAGSRRGQTLRMNLEIGAQSKSLMLANGAYVDDTGGQWVFVVSPDNSTAEKRTVAIGRRNPDMVEITGGLEEDERVITSGYDQLMDFDRIDLRQNDKN